uniref:Uncharacterized protein n=1 Tax=Oryza meridionalis TaxID=40149 RepID=A0A0E0CSN8_9ORYZ
EALTTIRIEVWGARSSTSTLGLVLPGFTTNGPTSGSIDPFLFLFLFLLLPPPVIFFSLPATERREGGGAPVLQWWNGLDGGGQACSRATRTRGSQWLAERVEELAGTSSRRASLRLQGRWLWWLDGVDREEGKLEKWIPLVEASPLVRGFGL